MYKLSQPNISDELIHAVTRILRSGQLVQGSECAAFERELAAFIGCKEVVLVSSGTAALYLAVKSLGIGPGDAVLLPDFTFPATANAVVAAGARVVLVDVERESYTINTRLLEQTIKTWCGKEKLRAILPVHEFGCPANLSEIFRIADSFQLKVIEDAACALGATVEGQRIGSEGNLACFSFHPRKTLTTGEGGAISTNSVELATRLRCLRNHGIERSVDQVKFIESSLNYRLTDFQAAMGRTQLPSLPEWIERRHALVLAYAQGLARLQMQGSVFCPNKVAGHSWQTYMIILSEKFLRSEVIECLRAEGVESNLGAQSLFEINLYGEQPHPPKTGPMLYRQGLALPLHEQMTEEDVALICQILEKVLSGLIRKSTPPC